MAYPSSLTISAFSALHSSVSSSTFFIFTYGGSLYLYHHTKCTRFQCSTSCHLHETGCVKSQQSLERRCFELIGEWERANLVVRLARMYICMYVSIRRCALSTTVMFYVTSNFTHSIDPSTTCIAIIKPYVCLLSVMDSERTVRERRSSESAEAREQQLARDRARQRERHASETAETRSLG